MASAATANEQVVELTWDHERLAQHFSPVLALSHEVDAPALEERDYHPRDIRLVLSQVRGCLHEGSGPGEVVGRLARGFPRQTLIIVALVIACWAFIVSDPEESLRDLRDKSASSGMAELVYALLTFALVFVFAGHAMPQMRRRSLFLNAGWALLPIVPVVFLSLVELDDPMALVEPGVWQFRVILACLFYALTWITFGTLMAVWDRRPHSSRPADVLSSITNEASENPERAKKAFLSYYTTGPPGDRAMHRAAYDKVLADQRLNSVRLTDESRSQLPVTAYARVVEGKNHFVGHVAIQYWLAYFYNDWDSTHEMDWEQVTVFLRRTARGFTPEACGFSVHTSGVVVRWGDVWKAPGAGGLGGVHPIVHVARGSHANYPRPGFHRTYLRLAGLTFTASDLPSLFGSPSPLRYVDNAQAWYEGLCTRPVVRLIPPPDNDGIWQHPGHQGACQTFLGLCDQDFRWLNLRGKWGWIGGLIGGDTAPQSPTGQAAWRDPFYWLDGCEPMKRSMANSMLKVADDDPM